MRNTVGHIAIGGLRLQPIPRRSHLTLESDRRHALCRGAVAPPGASSGISGTGVSRASSALALWSCTFGSLGQGLACLCLAFFDDCATVNCSKELEMQVRI